MKTTLIFFFVFLSVIIFGQSGRYYGNPSDASALCKIRVDAVNSFSSNREAENALQRIIDVTGISKRFALYQCNGIDNCEALTYRGIRYIFYDANFMKSISMGSGSSWTNISILAHEVGHHVNAHALDLLSYETGQIGSISLAEKRQQEIEADEFSGYVMYKLGASLYQAQAAINKFGNTGDDTYSTHPNKTKRLAAISRGYNKAKTEHDRYKVKTLTASDYFYLAYNAKEDDYQYKIDNYTKCIQLEPKQSSAYNNRANCYKRLAGKNYENKALQKEYYDKAISDYSRAVSLKVNDDFYYFNRAICYENFSIDNEENKEHYIQMAKKDYDKAISLNLNKFSYYSQRARFHINTSRDYLTAVNDATKCISLATDSLEFSTSYQRRANANESLGNYDLALNDNEMAMKYGGVSLYFVRAKGRIYEKKGEYPMAIENYELAIELGLAEKDDDVLDYHQLPHVYRLKAKLCMKIKDYQEAISAYTKMLELPHDLYCPQIEYWYPSVYAWRADAYLTLNDSVKALVDLNKAIEEAPDWAYAYGLRADFYYNNQDYEMALIDYNKAIKLDPSTFLNFALRGDCKRNLEDYVGAITDYNSYIELEPNDSKAYYFRARCLGGISKFEEAIVDYTKALELNPQNSEAYFWRGVAKNNFGLPYCSDFREACDLNYEYACEICKQAKCD